MAHDHGANDNRQHNRRSNWVFIGFLAIGGYFLITEHRAHLLPFLGYLPFLLLLACPLMHIFHHGGHGGHESHGSGQKESTSDQQKDKPTDHQSHTTKGES
ncbi:MAG TPA: DUF2933 domain-containing protein [Candidatus Kapabacteria bacterium]|nr:DUF2933 domain-containing protein [Candidatus Kapabacteria bacterium]